MFFSFTFSLSMLFCALLAFISAFAVLFSSLALKNTHKNKAKITLILSLKAF